MTLLLVAAGQAGADDFPNARSELRFDRFGDERGTGASSDRPDAAVQVPIPMERAFGLRAENVNDFAAGYNPVSHTYREEWIKEVLLNPQTRPVRATACEIPVTRVLQSSVNDDRGCQPLRVRVPPQGVRAIRWTLQDDGLGGQMRIFATETRELRSLRGDPENVCRALERPIVVTDRDCTFLAAAPIPTDVMTGASANYQVRMEMLNSEGEVLYFASDSVSIPIYVPLIVSVGDSMASGEGNPDRSGVENGNSCHLATTYRYKFKDSRPPDLLRPAEWFDKRDHRSLRSAPALAARDLLSDWPYVTFLTFAKSGSRTREPGPPTDESVDVREQLEKIDHLVEGHRIDALLITVGANDVGFADILEGLGGRDMSRGAAVTRFIRNLLTLRGEENPDDGYPAVAEQIETLGLNVSNVVITEYPGSLFNDQNNEPRDGCGLFELGTGSVDLYEIDEEEAFSIWHMGRVLNEEVELAAERLGWHLVDGIDERFKGHGYCSGQSYYVFAEDTCSRQGDFEGMLHPNGPGTSVIAEETARVLRQVLPAPPKPEGAQDPVIGLRPLR
ncbi:MAG: hypothetical protein ACRC67_27265 [Inquilinus sp.]|uniref:hypothetical protein n=1 Tax=Inquilinus sp. TaxID=1932117 RepID=UPI003F2A0AF4